MDDQSKLRSGGAVLVLLLVALISLPMLYVLSIGPVFWLANENGQIEHLWVIETAYWPLGWTAENVPAVGPALDSYVQWWSPPNDAVYDAPSAATVPVPVSTPAPTPAGS
jgi:hypothetical protein